MRTVRSSRRSGDLMGSTSGTFSFSTIDFKGRPVESTAICGIHTQHISKIGNLLGLLHANPGYVLDLVYIRWYKRIPLPSARSAYDYSIRCFNEMLGLVVNIGWASRSLSLVVAITDVTLKPLFTNINTTQKTVPFCRIASVTSSLLIPTRL